MYPIECLRLIAFGLLIATNVQSSLAHSVEENQAFIKVVLDSLNNNENCYLPSFEEIDELEKSFTELALAYGPNFDSSLSDDQKLALRTVLDQWDSFQQRMTSDIVIRSAKKRAFLQRVERYQVSKFGYSVCSNIKNIKGPIVDRIFEKNPHVRYIKHLQTNEVIERSREGQEFVPSKAVLDDKSPQDQAQSKRLPLDESQSTAGENLQREQVELESKADSKPTDVEEKSRRDSQDALEESVGSSNPGDQEGFSPNLTVDKNIAKVELSDYSNIGQIEMSKLPTSSTRTDIATIHAAPLTSEINSSGSDDDDEVDSISSHSKSEQKIEQPIVQSNEQPVIQSNQQPGIESDEKTAELETENPIGQVDEQPDESGIVHRMIGQFTLDLPGPQSNKISIQIQHQFGGSSGQKVEEEVVEEVQSSQQNLDEWYDPMVDIPFPSSTNFNIDAAQKDSYQPTFDFQTEQNGPSLSRTVEDEKESEPSDDLPEYRVQFDEFGAELMDESEDDIDLERLVRVPSKDWDFDPIYGSFKWPDEIPLSEQYVEPQSDSSIKFQWAMFTNDPKEYENYLESLKPKFNPGEVRRRKQKAKQQFLEEMKQEQEDARFGWHGNSVGSILNEPTKARLQDRWIKIADNSLCKIDYNVNYIKKVGNKVSKKIFGQKKSWLK